MVWELSQLNRNRVSASAAAVIFLVAVGGIAFIAHVLNGPGQARSPLVSPGTAQSAVTSLSATPTVTPSGSESPAATASTSMLNPSPTPPVRPEAQGGAAMTWDDSQRDAMLFDISGQTWLWDGTAWSLAHPLQSPPARGWASIAYDAGRRQVVLFGGFLGGSNTNDTWTWDGITWTQQHPAINPPPAQEAPMTYDAMIHRVILIDGDTWSWDGQTWTKLSVAGPADRPGNSGLAYDAARGVVVLCTLGSGDMYKLPPFETWIFDGSTWKQVSRGSGPPWRSMPNFVYDAATQTAVLYGGAFANLNDTWVWNGSSWSELHPATSPPHLTGSGPNPAETYDPIHGLVLLFGGYNYSSASYLNSLWAWDGITWRQLQ